MKKITLIAAVLLALSFKAQSPAATINDAERKFAADLLLQTEAGVINSVAGLSDAQLNFKPAPDKWSVAECIKHIAITETSLWQMTNGVIQAAPNPEKRNEVKATDQEVVQMIESREKKVKTFSAMEPQNTPYKSMEEAMKSFISDRSKLIQYVKSTDADLRNHVNTLPFASFAFLADAL